MIKKRYLVAIISFIVLGSGVVGATIVSRSKTQQESFNLFGKEETKIIYNSSNEGLGTSSITTVDYGITKQVSQKQTNQVRNKIYISPDKKYLAVTYNANESETLTYITDLEGDTMVEPKLGYFVSWSPDSSKVLLFISDVQHQYGRRIYYLSIDGQYDDFGLPEGSTGADISLNGDIAYTLTDIYTDRSDIYVRSADGTDTLLVKGNDNIFAWIRWSPDGQKIAFMKTDLLASADNQTVWVINKDGSGLEEISKVTWGYPAVWSSDNIKIAFAYRSNIFEYNFEDKKLNQKTNFSDGLAQYPNYSLDGQTIVFTLSDGLGKQIWSVRGGNVEKITENGDNVYPNLAQ